MSLIAAPEAAPAAPAVAAVEPATPAVAAPALAGVDALSAALDTPAAPAVGVPVAPEAVAAPARPEGVPDALWDAATGLKTPEVLARLGELEAAESIRKEGVPADAAGYKLELPAPVNDPVTGKPIAIDATDPLAVAATSWAHENGVSQAALSGLLNVFVQNEMTSLAAVNADVATETAKLGAGAEARITAVTNGLTQHAGADGAAAIMGSLSSAAGVIALEKVLKGLSGPSLGPPPPGNPANKHAGLAGVDLLTATLK